MRNIAIIMVIFLLAGCKQECNKKKPSYKFDNGEMAVHLPTGESVRVIEKMGVITVGACTPEYYANYNVRFSDGAEIVANWKELNRTNVIQKTGDRE